MIAAYKNIENLVAAAYDVAISRKDYEFASAIDAAIHGDTEAQAEVAARLEFERQMGDHGWNYNNELYDGRR